jgi:methylphosphotriester-DNA--protein-cysteine methyltransferase
VLEVTQRISLERRKPTARSFRIYQQTRISYQSKPTKPPHRRSLAQLPSVHSSRTFGSARRLGGRDASGSDVHVRKWRSGETGEGYARLAVKLDEKVCDQARLARDARFDGRFFIGVLSTGIYCRPICPSPTSKRRKVRFFESAAAAVEAGFRPCPRCRPEVAPGTPAWSGTSTTVSRALRMIAEGAVDERGIEAMSGRLGVSSRHLHRLFLAHLDRAHRQLETVPCTRNSQARIPLDERPQQGVTSRSPTRKRIR